MDFRKFLTLIYSVLSKLPPMWTAVIFLILGFLIVIAVKRIFF